MLAINVYCTVGRNACVVSLGGCLMLTRASSCKDGPDIWSMTRCLWHGRKATISGERLLAVRRSRSTQCHTHLAFGSILWTTGNWEGTGIIIDLSMHLQQKSTHRPPQQKAGRQHTQFEQFSFRGRAAARLVVLDLSASVVFCICTSLSLYIYMYIRHIYIYIYIYTHRYIILYMSYNMYFTNNI